MLTAWQDFLAPFGGIFVEGHLAHFGSLQAELSALEGRDCIVPLSHLGCLNFSGKEAKAFLQGQITCNIDDINPSHALLGAHCNLQGRMLCFFRAYTTIFEEAYKLVLPQDMLEIAQQNFKKYALFSQVQIEILANLTGIGIYGPSVTNILSHLGFSSLETPYDCQSLETQFGQCTLMRLPGNFPRYEIWATWETIKQLWKLLVSDYYPVSPSGWDLLDIRTGIPAVKPATLGLVLPHHANLAQLKAISFNKGCYLGQEIIARMQYRGKIKKHLYHAFVQTSVKPSPGDHIFTQTSGNEPVGMVISAAQNQKSAVELLIILDESFKDSNHLQLNSLEGLLLVIIEEVT
ncbi:MAG: folate-binding protein YgfZ [Proteobacteria bacterium]|nr:folate-binding protein YgfZ [Pseudomonadota bacterium]